MPITYQTRDERALQAELTLATLCDMVLGEDAVDRSDKRLIRMVGLLLNVANAARADDLPTNKSDLPTNADDVDWDEKIGVDLIPDYIVCVWVEVYPSRNHFYKRRRGYRVIGGEKVGNRRRGAARRLPQMGLGVAAHRRTQASTARTGEYARTKRRRIECGSD